MNDRRRSESTPHALVLDNYDSFTWNLVQALACLGAEVTVRRNDELSVEDALDLGA
ncbi:MAG: aminodeoxychorismate/anthranilate synthase component II, partial [marine benthic group bacterium]|nr:aminodeoxychorismate/anthranilate synthase component II [Gemmatimonadota bacterium]